MSLNLITDRTPADVAYAESNRDNATPNKGAYNAADFNRVGAALNYLSDLLFSHGYGPNPRLRDDWIATENMSYQDATTYLQTIRQIRVFYSTLPTTPDLPMDIHELFNPGGHVKANDIERFLLDIEGLITLMSSVFLRCGTTYSGGPHMYIKNGG